MALEEEIMKADQKAEQEEEKETKNPDDLTDEEIEYYITKYKPMDKAGAYGAQEWIGYIGMENIEGSYFNVMGLPVQRLYNELKKIPAL